MQRPELVTFADMYLTEFAAQGIAALEALLDKHARFDAYCRAMAEHYGEAPGEA